MGRSPCANADRRRFLGWRTVCQSRAWVVVPAALGLGWAVPAWSQTWNLNANGNWGTAGNWTPTTVPNAIDATASLGTIITAPRTVTLDIPVTIGTLNLSGAQAYTVSGVNSLTFDVSSGGAALNVTGAAAHTIATAVALNDSLVLSQGSTGTLSLAGAISGSGSLTKSGSGAVTLSGANNYSGTTTISAGTLSIGAGGTAGTLGTGAASVASGATLQINRSDATFTLANDISGAGTLTKSAAGTNTTLVLTGNNTISGTINVTEGTIQVGAGGTAGSIGTAGVVTTGGTLAFNRSDAITAGNVISGSGALSQAGSGTTTLTGANTYSGTTTISAGTLSVGAGGTAGTLGTGAVTNNASLTFNRSDALSAGNAISGSGTVTQAGTGTLALSGVISGTNSLNVSGSGATTLTGANTYTGTTTIAAGASLQVGNAGTTGALGTGAVTNNGGLTFNRTNAQTVANAISGSGTLTQAGSGTTSLTGNNTYAGTTTISAGTLSIGAGGTAGTLGTGAASVASGATLQINRSDAITVANDISGAGTLTKLAAGTTSLTGNNTYAGTTTISAGTLSIGAGGTAGTLGTGAVTNNATLQFNRSDDVTIAAAISGTGALSQVGSGTTTLTGANTYSGTTTISAGTLSVGAGGTAGTLGTGAVVNNGTLAFNRSNSISIANVISGTGGVTQAGAGTTTLLGANTYSGTTTISGGSLQIGAGGTSGALGSGNVVNNGTLVFYRSDAITVAGNIGGTGGVVQAGGGTTTLTGSNSYAGPTTILVGTLIVGAGGTSGTIGMGAVSNNGVLTFNRSDALTVAGAISGTGSINHIGTGTTTLAANNTYSGITTISAGTLQIGAGGSTGSLGTGAVVNNSVLDFNLAEDVTVANPISGTGRITQMGSGKVTLTGVNTFSGGTTVSNGLVSFSTLSAFGSGQITLNGGGLQWAPGNTIDVSGQFGPLGPNGGNLDTNGNNVTFASPLSGSGGITKQGAGILNLTAANTYTGPTSITGGTLAVNGSVTSNVTVGTGGTLGGNGVIFGTVTNGGTVAPGNSIGTLNVNGSFVQAAGGTYQVEVNAGGQNDRLNVSGAAGTATLQGGTVQVLAQPGIYGNSTRYTIVNATGGVSGAYSSVTSNFAFLTPSLSYDANNVYLTLALNNFSIGGFTVNQKAVGAALDQSYASASGDYATVIGALLGLSTTQAWAALDAMSGQPYANFGTINVNNNMLFMNAVSQQMAAARGAMSSGATRQALGQNCDIGACEAESPFTVWLSAIGGLGSVLGNGNASTMTYNVGGSAVGVDYRLDPRFMVGLGIGYTHATQWVDSFMGKGWSDALNVAAYASFREAGFYATGIAGYAYANNQMQRQIAIPGLQPRTANGSAGVNQLFGQLETGYRLPVLDRALASVTPFARISATTATQGAFTEWGAQSLSLNIAQQTTNSLRSVLGAEVAGSIPLDDGRGLDLALRLGWQHEFADTGRPITAAFAGAPTAPFTVYGVTPQRDSALIGFSASKPIGGGASLFVRYDGDIGSGADNHALSLGFRLSW